jgi:hypothetical protein
LELRSKNLELKVDGEAERARWRMVTASGPDPDGIHHC